jgi:hypothetical protein
MPGVTVDHFFETRPDSRVLENSGSGRDATFDLSPRHRFAPPHPVNASRRRDLPLLASRRGLIARNGPDTRKLSTVLDL